MYSRQSNNDAVTALIALFFIRVVLTFNHVGIKRIDQVPCSA